MTNRSELVERIVECIVPKTSAWTPLAFLVFSWYILLQGILEKKEHEELHHSASYAIPDFASKSYAAMLPRHSSWKKKASFKNICEESGFWCHFWSNIDESFNRSNTELDLESLKRHTNTLDFITCLAWQIFDSFHGSSRISEPSFPCFPNRDQRRPVRLCEGLPHLLPNDPHRALLEWCRMQVKRKKTKNLPFVTVTIRPGRRCPWVLPGLDPTLRDFLLGKIFDSKRVKAPNRTRKEDEDCRIWMHIFHTAKNNASIFSIIDSITV